MKDQVLWKCRNNHVMGIVQRVRTSSNGARQHASRLILFRQALDHEPREEEVDVIGEIEGTVLGIRCSVPGCDAVRSWWMQVRPERISK